MTNDLDIDSSTWPTYDQWPNILQHFSKKLSLILLCLDTIVNVWLSSCPLWETILFSQFPDQWRKLAVDKSTITIRCCTSLGNKGAFVLHINIIFLLPPVLNMTVKRYYPTHDLVSSHTEQPLRLGDVFKVTSAVRNCREQGINAVTPHLQEPVANLSVMFCQQH